MLATCDTWPTDDAVTLFRRTDRADGVGYKHPFLPQMTIAVEMYTSSPGTIRSVRWLRAQGDQPSGHVGKVYDEAGTVLASTGVSANLSCASGQWVSARLTRPLEITASKRYLIAVDGVGGFAGSWYFFSKPRRRGRIMVPYGGGLYAGPNQYPTLVENLMNYWVDGE